MTGVTRAHKVTAATAKVEAWIRSLAPGTWAEPRDAAWNNQDLLGHLAAWSDLLADQIEAMRDERPQSIEAVDVDAWNAAQVAARRGLPVHETIDDWRRAAHRMAALVASLPNHATMIRQVVAWAEAPMTIDDVVALWFTHLEQHRLRLTPRDTSTFPA